MSRKMGMTGNAQLCIFVVCTYLKTLVLLTYFVSRDPLFLHLDSLCRIETLESQLFGLLLDDCFILSYHND